MLIFVNTQCRKNGTKRGSISYKPTGWVQYLYGENNNKHLYERCHLIAWQLGNENNNKQNLITGDRKSVV